MVRYFREGIGEVTWEEMAVWLDRRSAAAYGRHVYVLLGALGMEPVRLVRAFLP